MAKIRKCPRYRFLLPIPVKYVRDIGFGDNITTNVKYLTIAYNRVYDNYTIFLYDVDRQEDWEKATKTKFFESNMPSSDSFFLEVKDEEKFLQHFGLK